MRSVFAAILLSTLPYADKCWNPVALPPPARGGGVDVLLSCSDRVFRDVQARPGSRGEAGESRTADHSQTRRHAKARTRNGSAGERALARLRSKIGRAHV